MAKFCKKCGAPLEEDAKFCSGCGATLDSAPPPTEPAPEQSAPPPVIASDSKATPPPPVIASDSEATPPPAPPPEQPVYKPPVLDQQAYMAAPAKPKKKFPIWLLIVIIAAAAIVAIVLVANVAVGNVAGKDYFELGPDQIPTVKQVLGEERKVSSYNSTISNGIQTVTVVYKVEENQRGEMKTYAETLMNSHGFINTTDINFDLSTASGYQFATESREEGYIILLDIDYDENGYTLTFTRGVGTLTRNVEEPAVEEEEEEEEPAEEEEEQPDFPVQIMVPAFFEEFVMDDMENAARERGFVIERNNDGSFTYFMTEEDQAFLMEDFKSQLQDMYDDMVNNDEHPGLVKIEYEEDQFDWVVLKVTDEFFKEKMTGVLAIFYVAYTAPMYKAYMGLGDMAQTVVSWVKWDTEEVIDSLTSPDEIFRAFELN